VNLEKVKREALVRKGAAERRERSGEKLYPSPTETVRCRKMKGVEGLGGRIEEKGRPILNLTRRGSARCKTVFRAHIDDTPVFQLMGGEREKTTRGGKIGRTDNEVTDARAK